MAKANMVATGRKTKIVDEPDLTNQELIHGLIREDPAAAIAFHYRYSKRISRWVWRLLGTDQEHDDVVQQVFVGVFNSFTKIRNAESLDSWVDSVTIKTIRYELRKRKARRALFLDRTQKDPDNSRDPKSPFKQSHIRHFYEILNNMPSDDRIVFVLRFLEGHTLGHIASVGDYSYSTAKRRLKRAEALFTKRVLRDFTLVSLVEESYAVSKTWNRS